MPLTERSINVFVFDRNSHPIAGAKVKVLIRGEEVGTAETRGLADTPVVFHLPQAVDDIVLVATYDGFEKTMSIDEREINHRFVFEQVEAKAESAGSGFSPLDILNAARKAVPAVDYALGVAGIAAAGAILLQFLGKGHASVVIIGGLFIAMVLLFIFATLVATKAPSVIRAGVVLIWAVLVFFCIFLGFTVSAFAFGWPGAWAAFLGISATAAASNSGSGQDDPVAKDVASGSPSGKCAAEAHGSAVQLFEHGWLVANFERSLHLAIFQEADGQISWLKTREEAVPVSVPCTGIEHEDRLILGFRAQYCDPKANALRVRLGQPLENETRAWIQYQEWSDGGLLVYGMTAKAGVQADGFFQALAAAFLDDVTSESDQGHGRIKVVTSDFVKDAYCTPLWYPAQKDLSQAPALQSHAPKCLTMPSPERYVEKRPKCTLTGF